jgi:hypothetical protein
MCEFRFNVAEKKEHRRRKQNLPHRAIIANCQKDESESYGMEELRTEAGATYATQGATISHVRHVGVDANDEATRI